MLFFYKLHVTQIYTQIYIQIKKYNAKKNTYKLNRKCCILPLLSYQIFETQKLLSFTPFQLLSHFQIVTNSQLLKFQTDKVKQNNFLEQIYKTNLQQLKFLPNSFDKNIKEQPQKTGQQKLNNQKTKNTAKANKNYYYRRNRAKPVLTQQAQAALANWISNKVEQNVYIRRKDIAQKARKLSNHPNFSASKGWVNRYLGRHQQLKAQLNRIARANKGKRIHNQFQDSSSSDEFDQVEKYMVQNGQQDYIKEDQSMNNQKFMDQQAKIQSKNNNDYDKDQYFPNIIEESLSEYNQQDHKKTSFYTINRLENNLTNTQINFKSNQNNINKKVYDSDISQKKAAGTNNFNTNNKNFKQTNRQSIKTQIKSYNNTIK